MPKWMLFALGAVADFVVAFFTYRSGRVVIPLVLAVAGLCFVAAAIGSARGMGGGKRA